MTAMTCGEEIRVKDPYGAFRRGRRGEASVRV